MLIVVGLLRYPARASSCFRSKLKTKAIMVGLRQILLVGNNPAVIDDSLMAIERLQIVNTVVVARDSVEALNYLDNRRCYRSEEAEKPVMIIVDVSAPNAESLALLDSVCNELGLRSTPLVLLASSSEEADVARIFLKERDMILIMPVDALSLLKAVQGLGVFWSILDRPPGLDQPDHYNTLNQ